MYHILASRPNTVSADRKRHLLSQYIHNSRGPATAKAQSGAPHAHSGRATLPGNPLHHSNSSCDRCQSPLIPHHTQPLPESTSPLEATAELLQQHAAGLLGCIVVPATDAPRRQRHPPHNPKQKKPTWGPVAAALHHGTGITTSS